MNPRELKTCQVVKPYHAVGISKPRPTCPVLWEGGVFPESWGWNLRGLDPDPAVRRPSANKMGEFRARYGMVYIHSSLLKVPFSQSFFPTSPATTHGSVQ